MLLVMTGCRLFHILMVLGKKDVARHVEPNVAPCEGTFRYLFLKAVYFRVVLQN